MYLKFAQSFNVLSLKLYIHMYFFKTKPMLNYWHQYLNTMYAPNVNWIRNIRDFDVMPVGVLDHDDQSNIATVFSRLSRLFIVGSTCQLHKAMEWPRYPFEIEIFHLSDVYISQTTEYSFLLPEFKNVASHIFKHLNLIQVRIWDIYRILCWRNHFSFSTICVKYDANKENSDNYYYFLTWWNW